MKHTGRRFSKFFNVSRRQQCPLCVPCSSRVMYIQVYSQFEMAISIQQTASEICDDTKVYIKVSTFWLVTETDLLNRKRPWNVCIPERADHKTILKEQGLRQEVCTDGTCVKVLDNITKWANNCSLASPHIFWLAGQAGSSKTTIACTIAKWFKGNNANQHTVMGGSFLC